MDIGWSVVRTFYGVWPYSSVVGQWARQGKAKARQGKARQGKGKVKVKAKIKAFDSRGSIKARQGKARQCKANGNVQSGEKEDVQLLCLLMFVVQSRFYVSCPGGHGGDMMPLHRETL